MLVTDIQKYLIAAAAACLIGLGSGFLTFGQYVFDRDKEAAEASYEFEKVSGVVMEQTTDCENVADHKAECKYAFYLKSSSEGILEVLLFVADILLVAATCFLAGAGTIEVWRKK
ncbi:hypothetical protein [Kineobactrum salinum]|uniref:Uncharacterized protein n=1 Tax=Kineobactrum salinum TaxID=2708301 RepID=A0A6C0U888_9GAMM|nr:hypothetical protein [Kineobactrum salinum]QIB65714.1 hypothetical protein G3T16_10095 [Kineobactrum salinum]